MRRRAHHAYASGNLQGTLSWLAGARFYPTVTDRICQLLTQPAREVLASIDRVLLDLIHKCSISIRPRSLWDRLSTPAVAVPVCVVIIASSAVIYE